MSLMAASGPFGHAPQGRFNFEPPRRKGVLYWEPSPRRVRGLLGDEVVVDSRRVMLLHETGHMPVWYFPRDDVRLELLEASQRRTRCPWKGEASYWSVRVGEREELALVWTYTKPRREVEPIAGRLCFFNERVDLELDGELQERPRTQWSSDDWARGG